MPHGNDTRKLVNAQAYLSLVLSSHLVRDHYDNKRKKDST